MVQKYRYEEMLPNEFIAAVQKMPVFFIPTGLLEWHDNHLPLGLDALKAHGLCMRIAQHVGGGIVLPPNYYGRPGYASYIGTLTFSEPCLHLLFSELFGQLQKVGAKIIVLLTGHYGPVQVDFIKRVADSYMIEHPEIRIIAQPEYEGIMVDGEQPNDHAGKWETSVFWNMYPELTHMENFNVQTTRKQVYEHPHHNWYQEDEEWVWKEDLTQVASRELGAKTIDLIVQHIGDKVVNALQEVLQ